MNPDAKTAVESTSLDAFELLVDIAAKAGVDDIEVGLLPGYPPTYRIVVGERIYEAVVMDPSTAGELIALGIERELAD